MTELTRRLFLQNAPVTAATLSVLPAMPVLAAARDPRKDATPEPSFSGAGSMVIHVNNIATGEMTLLVGTREIVLRDPQLVARFVEAAG